MGTNRTTNQKNQQNQAVLWFGSQPSSGILFCQRKKILRAEFHPHPPWCLILLWQNRCPLAPFLWPPSPPYLVPASFSVIIRDSRLASPQEADPLPLQMSESCRLPRCTETAPRLLAVMPHCCRLPECHGQRQQLPSLQGAWALTLAMTLRHTMEEQQEQVAPPPAQIEDQTVFSFPVDSWLIAI